MSGTESLWWSIEGEKLLQVEERLFQETLSITVKRWGLSTQTVNRKPFIYVAYEMDVEGRDWHLMTNLRAHQQCAGSGGKTGGKEVAGGCSQTPERGEELLQGSSSQTATCTGTPWDLVKMQILIVSCSISQVTLMQVARGLHFE